LKERFAYAQAHPALLPAAWAHRVGRYVASGKAKQAGEGMSIAQERLEMLSKLGMRGE